MPDSSNNRFDRDLDAALSGDEPVSDIDEFGPTCQKCGNPHNWIWCVWCMQSLCHECATNTEIKLGKYPVEDLQGITDTVNLDFRFLRAYRSGRYFAYVCSDDCKDQFETINDVKLKPLL